MTSPVSACPHAGVRTIGSALAVTASVAVAAALGVTPAAAAPAAPAAPVALAATVASWVPTDGAVTAAPVLAPSLVSAADRRRVARVSGSLRRLRGCESGGGYRTNTGNGYYGAYQFDAGTWRGMGFSGLPHTAPAVVQDAAAARLQAHRGWAPWPACSQALGLR